MLEITSSSSPKCGFRGVILPNAFRLDTFRQACGIAQGRKTSATNLFNTTGRGCDVWCQTTDFKGSGIVCMKPTWNRSIKFFHWTWSKCREISIFKTSNIILHLTKIERPSTVETMIKMTRISWSIRRFSSHNTFSFATAFKASSSNPTTA